MISNNKNNKSNAIFYTKSNTVKEIEDIVILILNTMMYTERKFYLKEKKHPNNKANGYRSISVRGEGGERLTLAIPRDRLTIFRPYLIKVLKSEGSTIYALCHQLYHSDFISRKIRKLFVKTYSAEYTLKTITIMIRIFKPIFRTKFFKIFY